MRLWSSVVLTFLPSTKILLHLKFCYVWNNFGNLICILMLNYLDDQRFLSFHTRVCQAGHLHSHWIVPWGYWLLCHMKNMFYFKSLIHTISLTYCHTKFCNVWAFQRSFPINIANCLNWDFEGLQWCSSFFNNQIHSSILSINNVKLVYTKDLSFLSIQQWISIIFMVVKYETMHWFVNILIT